MSILPSILHLRNPSLSCQRPNRAPAQRSRPIIDVSHASDWCRFGSGSPTCYPQNRGSPPCLLLESAKLIDEHEAERRVLVLENPGLEGQSAITESLFAGLQLIMPGEIAPSHRHTPAALRFILESDNAYTSVDGERVYMSPGDFIVTPSWSWHDHVSESNDPVVWLDVLDLPTVRALGPRFAEHYPHGRVPERVALGSTTTGQTSPLRYPYDRVREALEQLKEHSEWDTCHGLKREYVDPTTGSPAVPTI